MARSSNRCPTSESLLKWVSICEELSWAEKIAMRKHLFFCKPCQNSSEKLQIQWSMCFAKEVDVTDSVLRVFSNLQNDSTLILKGWKFKKNKHYSKARAQTVFQTGVVLVVCLLVVLLMKDNTATQEFLNAETQNNKTPDTWTQIRFEDDTQTTVRYIEPELLHQAEFETVSYQGN